jgi:chromosome partitioning protein
MEAHSWRRTMRTIAVVNQKGGCGKTTISINLASALAGEGKSVLLVDMDPQSHCAVGLAVPEEQIEESIYDVLISKSRNEPIRLMEILWQISDRLELAPASIDLSAFEQQMSGIADRECCLKNVIDEVSERYDYAVIDCPPAVGLLTFNALRSATDVIVPVETGYFALHGLSKQLETLSILCKRSKQKVNVKVLASMYDIRTKMAREILAELKDKFADRMFKTIVNFNTKIKEAASFGQPINEYDPASKGQKDFQSLAQEVIGAEAGLQSREIVNSLADQLESISTSAADLLEAAKPASGDFPQGLQESSIRAISKSPVEMGNKYKRQTDELKGSVDIDAKLSDYYGVNQIEDALVFVTLYPRAQSVNLAGDFNNWEPERTPMQRVGHSGVWQTKLKLPEGTYRYRLVVDGQWQQDPYNESTELNPFGEFNSVAVVK